MYRWGTHTFNLCNSYSIHYFLGYQGPPHPHSMPNRGPMMRPPYGGPGPQGPMPPFHGGPPMEQKKEPSKWKFNLLFTYAYLNVHLVFDLITQVCFST